MVYILAKNSYLFPPPTFSRPAKSSLKIAWFFAKFETILEILSQNRENLDI